MEKQNVVSVIGELQDVEGFREQYWTGSFEEYLSIVGENPQVARSAYQRLYDMILSYGTEEYTRNRETVVHYKFFDDPFDGGQDAIYGMDRSLMQLVQIFESEARAAAARPGRERQEHDRAVAEEGARGVLEDEGGGALHVHVAGHPGPGADGLPDARGAAPPDPGRVPR